MRVAIPVAKINAVITKIERPRPTGPGGDVVAIALLKQDIAAIHQGVNRSALSGFRRLRDADGDELIYDGTLWVDLLDAPQELRDVRAGDLVTWRSNRVVGEGAVDFTRAQVVRATPWEAPGTAFENFEIFVRSDAGGI